MPIGFHWGLGRNTSLYRARSRWTRSFGHGALVVGARSSGRSPWGGRHRANRPREAVRTRTPGPGYLGGAHTQLKTVHTRVFGNSRHCQRAQCTPCGWHERNRWQNPPRRRAASLLEGHEPPRAARARRAPQGCATAPTRRRRAAWAASPLHRCAIAPMTQTRLARAASSTFASSQANKQP